MPTDSTTSSVPAVDPQNPWLGLASFTEETRAFFHGRDEEVAELGRRVQRKLLTILFGQSGLGKTSILRAGIVPRLRPEGYCPVYVRLDYGKDSPPPAEQIKQAIIRVTREAGHWSRAGVAQAGESLWEFLHHRDDTLRDVSGRTLIPLLIFDQFEEVFTLAQGDDFGRQRAAQFLEELADLVENRPPRALEARLEADDASLERYDFNRSDYRLLIALREDYLAHLESLKNAMPSVTQNRMRLARMTGAQALAAVTRPGRGLVSEDVAKQIVTFVSGATDFANAEVEPSLLSLVCRELNETRRTRGHAEISADLLAGTRDTILTEFYERTLADQPAGVRAFIEDELLTDSGYRESIAEERVKKGFAAAGASLASLAALIDRRLLRVEERLDVRRVELTHDVLCAVVKASRDVRQEREAKESAERLLVETRATEAAARRALRRAQFIAAVCVVLAAAAIFGLWAASQARTRAERLAAIADQSRATAVAAQAAAKASAELTAQARARAEEVLNFMLVDLPDRLSEVGQPLLIKDVVEKALNYYESLPEALRTPDTIAGYGNALASSSFIFTNENDGAKSQAQIDKALALFERAERAGPLAPEVRLAYASALGAQANLLGGQARFDASLTMAERAEKMVTPVVNDPRLGARAQRVLSWAIFGQAFSKDRGVTHRRESVAEFERAVAAAQLADQQDPKLRYPGLQAVEINRLFAQALRALGENGRARAVTKQSLQTLETLLAGAPDAYAVKEALGAVASDVNSNAWPEWDEKEGAAAQARNLEAVQASLARDPKSWSLRNSVAIATSAERTFRANNGDWARLEQIIRETESRYDSENETNFMRANHAALLNSAAQFYAGIGRDREAEAYLTAANKEAALLLAEVGGDSVEHALREATQANTRRLTDQARLNYPAVQADAIATAKKLDALKAAPAYARRVQTAHSTAKLHEGRAALALGDNAAAVEAFTQWRAERTPRPPLEQQSKETRATNAGNEFTWAQALFRVGRVAEARVALAPAFAEAEALLREASTIFVAQKLMARALAARAEIESDLPAAERRAMLQRAKSLMVDNDNAQRLTRFEREQVLGEINAALAR